MAATCQIGRTLASVFGCGRETPIVATTSFHDLSARVLSEDMVKFDMFKDKVLLVANVATKCLTKQNYAELDELCSELKEEPFELPLGRRLAFPCNQFGKQEEGNGNGHATYQGKPEDIGNFITGKLPKANFTIFQKSHVNGKATHPAWHFCRYNAEETRRGKYMLPIPWNFAKFLLDKEGRVYKYYSPKSWPWSKGQSTN
ncbi:unnamed protein product [Effrenium voratum]|uniref:Glutathione peroxidase n=1 Tax=Effrenium voratum TaxID=2562239 RepID=A0AA36HTI3_9DINO|nr:unnamed protein product [Effrenium voratum]